MYNTFWIDKTDRVVRYLTIGQTFTKHCIKKILAGRRSGRLASDQDGYIREGDCHRVKTVNILEGESRDRDILDMRGHDYRRLNLTEENGLEIRRVY